MAWLVAMLADPEGLPELTFLPIEEAPEPEVKPEPVPQPVQPQWQPEPEPEPEPEEPWVIPPDPLAGGVMEPELQPEP